MMSGSPDEEEGVKQGETHENQHDVFLVHTGNEKTTVVMDLKKYLESQGFLCFLDSDMRNGDGDPRLQMEQALERCRYAVVVLSEAFLHRTDPCAELKYAHERMLWLTNTQGQYDWRSLWVILYDISVERYKSEWNARKEELPPIHCDIQLLLHGMDKDPNWSSLCTSLSEQLQDHDTTHKAKEKWNVFLSKWPFMNEADGGNACDFPRARHLYESLPQSTVCHLFGNNKLLRQVLVTVLVLIVISATTIGTLVAKDVPDSAPVGSMAQTQSPTAAPSICFQSREDLDDALENYVTNTNALEDNSRPINEWCVSKITAFDDLFYGKSAFNDAIGGWDVSNARSMEQMFGAASAFNQALSSWDVSLVADMYGVFGLAVNFDQNLTSWNTSSVRRMEGLFFSASSFNGDVSSWDVSHVENMVGVFVKATSFNGDLSAWNLSSAKSTASMFFQARSFNTDISTWTVSSIQNMEYMFRDASTFNIDISKWNVSAVDDMSWMFAGATSFNIDISGWDVTSVKQIHGMFNGASAFAQNLCAWGQKLPIDVRLTYDTTKDSPFVGTNCPDPSMPNMSASPPGPFCFACN